jgi:hypothetical protein
LEFVIKLEVPSTETILIPLAFLVSPILIQGGSRINNLDAPDTALLSLFKLLP